MNKKWCVSVCVYVCVCVCVIFLKLKQDVRRGVRQTHLIHTIHHRSEITSSTRKVKCGDTLLNDRLSHSRVYLNKKSH